MKKTTTLIGGIIIVLIVAVILLLKLDFNRLGKENVYVQLTDEPTMEEHVLDAGEVMKTYWYQLPAYNEEGEAMAVEFSASSILREDAYLMLYLNDRDEVTSYDEVKKEEIPAAAMEKMIS